MHPHDKNTSEQNLVLLQ